MPLFFYQSINSNSSHSQGVAASNSQRFTVQTHNQQAANQGAWRLSLPVASGAEPTTPIHGPAHLVPSAPAGYMAKGAHSDRQFKGMVEAKMRESHQHMHRKFGTACDLYVIGELNASNAEWKGLDDHVGNLFSAVTTGKTCNSFSAFAVKPGIFVELGSGMGWAAYQVMNVNVVFVHVPNSIATKTASVEAFYKSINQLVNQKTGADIDLVMGDTNQQSPSFTAKCVGAAVGKTFLNVHSQTDVNPYDAYERSFGGTNSNGSRMYDTAVYNSATARKVDYIYLSQAGFTHDSSAAAALTDHMGLAVQLEK
ncbi:hypothetical protein [Simiduia agarivorans]|uniref:Endonuclease/exonuclease/phosphatase domain-containing protein n=1 Tax=Simiduia agarivorans (strain DSM 21679 / JCM 13881 / BCRC 17597 / SA1) TaxID=1117647 RepID=K4KN87_SIMAS|nr:hypothetical protein [Simiduia agarivorans]AFV00507.1 hypothetical protein M5M_16880 [Simiduia agarivorans SA1 = DSM 21679]